jgi:hypothetical protein
MQVMIARLKRRDQWDSALEGVFQFAEFRKAFWLTVDDPAAPRYEKFPGRYPHGR